MHRGLLSLLVLEQVEPWIWVLWLNVLETNFVFSFRKQLTRTVVLDCLDRRVVLHWKYPHAMERSVTNGFYTGATYIYI